MIPPKNDETMHSFSTKSVGIHGNQPKPNSYRVYLSQTSTPVSKSFCTPENPGVPWLGISVLVGGWFLDQMLYWDLGQQFLASHSVQVKPMPCIEWKKYDLITVLQKYTETQQKGKERYPTYAWLLNFVSSKIHMMRPFQMMLCIDLLLCRVDCFFFEMFKEL